MRTTRYLGLVAALLLSAAGAVGHAQQSFKVGDVTAGPGEKRSGFIRVPAGTDCDAFGIPVTVIRGAKPGPVLALTAGVHGYEYPPILALQRLRREIEPAELSGTLILVHVMNLQSFLKRTTYYNPMDWKNQNRAFPGKADGTVTERTAYQITREVIAQCDALIDNHCGDSNEDLTPYVYCTATGNPAVDKKTKSLAESFGFAMIIHQRAEPGTPDAAWCAHSALFKGKAALTVECGKLGRTDEEYTRAIANRCRNAMKHLGMIPGQPEVLSQPVWVQRTTYIRSEHEGLFYALVRGGQHVEKGQMVGYLTDFFGNTIQEAFAPVDGIVMYAITTPPMSKGEPMVKIGSFR